MSLAGNAATSLRRDGPLVFAGHTFRSLSDRLMVAAAVKKLHRLGGGLGSGAAIDFAYDFAVGDVTIAPIQVRSEIEELLNRVEGDHPRTILEIGTANGGSLFLFTRAAHDQATIVSVDLPGGSFGGGYAASRVPLYAAFARAEQQVELIRADSHDPATRKHVERILEGRPVDFLFIDGDHALEGVRADFELYTPLVREGGLIAMHDIVPGSRDMVGGVPDFWRGVKERHEGEEIVADWNQGGSGIGVLRKQAR